MISWLKQQAHCLWNGFAGHQAADGFHLNYDGTRDLHYRGCTCGKTFYAKNEKAKEWFKNAIEKRKP
jgi:hypothetical protein